MVNEADFNRDIGKSLDWYYKIADDGSSIGIGGKRPFDGFGILGGKPIYWEAKYLHSPSAFNFKNLKQHQIDNLVTISTLAPDAVCFFILGVSFSPRELRAYVFTDMLDIKRRKDESKSILLKDLKSLTNYTVKDKGKFDLRRFI